MNVPTVSDLAVATRQVATKSAMNPIQWICGLTTPFCLVAACLTPAPMQYAVFVLAALPVLYAVRVYEHFMKSDPDRLQSERYLIEKQTIARMGASGADGSEMISLPLQGKLIENPLLNSGDRND